MHSFYLDLSKPPIYVRGGKLQKPFLKEEGIFIPGEYIGGPVEPPNGLHLPAPENPLNEVLDPIAAYLGSSGKGVLITDEAVGTVPKRKRRALRELFVTAPCVSDFFTGVVISESSMNQKTADGRFFVDVLKEVGVLPGVNFDKGLNGLAARCSSFHDAGGRFATRCFVFKFGRDGGSQLSISSLANSLASFAHICQQQQLVPIVHPQIIFQGPIGIARSYEFTNQVLKSCFDALSANSVSLSGIVFNMNVIAPGSMAEKVPAQIIAEYTIRALQRSVPSTVPAVILSGGQSAEEVTLILNAMNQLKGTLNLSFAFGRVLQVSTLKAWKRKTVEAAQDALLTRVKAISEAIHDAVSKLD